MTGPRALRLATVVAALALLVGGAMPDSSSARRYTSTFKVRFVCNDRGSVFPLAGARVEFYYLFHRKLPHFLGQLRHTTHANADGYVELNVSSNGVNDYFFRVVLDDDDGVRAEDWWSPWAWFADTHTWPNDVPVRDFGTQGIGNGTISPECAAYEGARRAYHGYRAEIGERPPYGNLKVNVNSPSSGVPFAPHVRIQWPPRYPPGENPGGFETTTHEFAHTFRHGFDGGLGEFLLDVARFEYPQRHGACKRTNSGFAFNEGWAEYWAGDFAPAPNCPGIPPEDHRVEGNVAAALTSLQTSCEGVDRRRMVDVLRRNPGRIHSLQDFERALACVKKRPPIRHLGRARSSPPLTLAQRLSFGRTQVATLGRAVTGLRRELGVAERVAAAPNPCRPRPCLAALEREIRPALVRGELAQAKLLRGTLAFQTSRRGLASLGAPESRRFQQALATKERAYQRSAAKLGEATLRGALRAAAPILRRDRSPAMKTVSRGLVRARAALRRGRLPAGFAMATPGGARLVHRGPLPGTDPTPAPAPAPGPGGPGPAPTANPLRGQWHLDEACDAPCQNADSSGNGLTGTQAGDPATVPGRFGNGLNFPTKNDYVNVGDQALLQPPTITLLAWVRSASTPATVKAIASQGASGSCSHSSYALYTGGSLDTSGLRFYIWNGSEVRVSPAASNTMWDGAWHLVAGTYDGATVRLYVDGVEVGSGTPSTGPIAYGLAVNNNFTIGNYANPPECLENTNFSGDVDETRVYGRALTQTEIARLAAAGSEPPVLVPDGQ